MSEHKFNVGDRVRVVAEQSAFKGCVGQIDKMKECGARMAFRVKSSDNSIHPCYYYGIDLEPAPAVKEPKATRSKLRFGDKVKVLESGHDWKGRICLVASVEEDKGKVWVYESHDTSVSAFVEINKLELIERDAFSKPDNVNHPPHYNQGGIECIEAIKAALGGGFVSYLRGNVIKYLWRCEHKGGVEDLRKAAFYLDRAMIVRRVPRGVAVCDWRLMAGTSL
jgi:hypothetical protein